MVIPSMPFLQVASSQKSVILYLVKIRDFVVKIIYKTPLVSTGNFLVKMRIESCYDKTLYS